MSRWPPASSYASILQIPRAAFVDPKLKACTIRRNSVNQPLGISGRFAVVYEALLESGQRLAIRLFTSDREERAERYELISNHLAQVDLPELVPFHFEPGAIRLDSGKLYPMVTMEWVSGHTLHEWVGRTAKKSDAADSLLRLSHRWIELMTHLREAQLAHGDLQHANIMVTNDNALKLVDYDCMCVPALAGRRNLEIGVVPYQHPQRDADTELSLELDNFSALVIFLALRGLAADPELWETHVEFDNNDSLLFRREDFEQGPGSALYRSLSESHDTLVRQLTERLFDYYGGDIADVPSLDSVLEELTPHPAVKTGTADNIESLWRREVLDSRKRLEHDSATIVPAPPNPHSRLATSQTDSESDGRSHEHDALIASDSADPEGSYAVGDYDDDDDTYTQHQKYGAPAAWEDDSTSRLPVEETPDEKCQTLAIAIREKNRTVFRKRFDARLVRQHADRFRSQQKTLTDLVREEFLADNSIGLGQSRGASLSAMPNGGGSQRARWTWPAARFAECCWLGVTQERLGDDADPQQIRLTQRHQVTREDYEDSRGRVIHCPPDQRGQYVYIWAIIDLGFAALVSKPVRLGRLSRGTPAAEKRDRNWWS